MNKNEAYLIGIDYGTDSCRTVMFDASDGSEAGSRVMEYPRWTKGLYCDPQANRFRQHPLDYLECLEFTVKETLAQAEKKIPGSAAKVKALGIDTTGSTPCAVDSNLTPLALLPGFEENPDAMFVLWKDHSAIAEAEEINRAVKNWEVDYTKYSGGAYSSEWFWAKALRAFRSSPGVAEKAVSVIEHCDWIPALLSGIRDCGALKRSRCTMGHKALWHSEWIYPSPDFLSTLDKNLVKVRESLGSETYTNVECAGTLCGEWAARLGLPAGIPISVGALDAHIGAIGGGAKANWNVKVMGTSTCDMIVSPKADNAKQSADGKEKPIRGICGQVDGSIIPGFLTYEAGQSAFGDIYVWYKNLLLWPLEKMLPSIDGVDGAARDAIVTGFSKKILSVLDEEAARAESSALLALDWHNGRRTPDVNPWLSGAISGITLGSDAPRIYRALVEATAFGSRAIAERLAEEGIRVEGVIAVGGIARKSSFVMQIMADVLNTRIEVPAIDQAGSLGAAMCASVCSGLYPDIPSAQKAMGTPLDTSYEPDGKQVKRYDELYRRYKALGKFVETQTGR
ncbi:MAG: ribulokinase [Treponema sp.]|jgi:L-ribulokinase|nr:ribulokinase [Treponema sp.]